MSLLRAALELGLSDAAALVLEEIALEDRSPRARVQTLHGGRERLLEVDPETRRLMDHSRLCT